MSVAFRRPFVHPVKKKWTTPSKMFRSERRYLGSGVTQLVGSVLWISSICHTDAVLRSPNIVQRSRGRQWAELFPTCQVFWELSLERATRTMNAALAVAICYILSLARFVLRVTVQELESVRTTGWAVLVSEGFLGV